MVPTFNQLMTEFPSKPFFKGETLLLKSEVPKHAYVVEKGIVEAYDITPDGAERQIALLTQGDDLPVGFGVGLTKRSEYFYRAYTDCIVRLVLPISFVMLLHKDVDALFQRYVQLDARLMLSFARIRALEHPKAGDKVAFLLVNLAQQVGTRFRPYKTRLRLVMTQQQLADALGLARETTGIELKKLEVMHLISHSRKSYVLYMERLQRYLDKR